MPAANHGIERRGIKWKWLDADFTQGALSCGGDSPVNLPLPLCCLPTLMKTWNSLFYVMLFFFFTFLGWEEPTFNLHVLWEPDTDRICRESTRYQSVSQCDQLWKGPPLIISLLYWYCQWLGQALSQVGVFCDAGVRVLFVHSWSSHPFCVVVIRHRFHALLSQWLGLGSKGGSLRIHSHIAHKVLLCNVNARTHYVRASTLT